MLRQFSSFLAAMAPKVPETTEEGFKFSDEEQEEKSSEDFQPLGTS